MFGVVGECWERWVNVWSAGESLERFRMKTLGLLRILATMHHAMMDTRWN